MGINHDPIEEDEMSTATRPTPLSRRAVDGSGEDRAEDPIWSLSHFDALRATRLYQDECGLLYPVVDIEPILTHLDRLYDESRPGGSRDTPTFDNSETDLTDIAKLVVAVGLALEGDGKSDVAQSIFDSMEGTISKSILSTPSIHSLVLLVLASTFSFPYRR